VSDYTPLKLNKISGALVDALREAYTLAQSGEFGEPLEELLHHARDLALHMAEQLAAVEALIGAP
jgi:hypothetical protein